MLGFNLLYFAAQVIIVFRIEGLMFPAWLVRRRLRAGGGAGLPVVRRPHRQGAGGPRQCHHQLHHVRRGLRLAISGGPHHRAVPGQRNGLQPRRATAGRIGIFLVAQLLAYRWYLAASPHKETCRMTNPVIAEVTRGGIVESRHRGAFAVVDRDGPCGGGRGRHRGRRLSALGHQGLPVPAGDRERCRRPFRLHRRGDRALLRLAQWRARACARGALHAGQGRQCRGPL